jgi:hypothetical protein
MHEANVLVHEPNQCSSFTAPQQSLLDPPLRWESLALSGLERSNYAACISTSSTIANLHHRNRQGVSP